MAQVCVSIKTLGISLAAVLSISVFGAELGNPVSDPFRVKSASDEARLAMKGFSLPDGYNVELTAAEPHLANPVAFHIDERGRFFVVETFRHGAGVLDIRGRRGWPNQDFIDSLSEERLATLSDELLDADLASRTVDDRIAMLRYYMGDKAERELATETDQVRLVEDRDGDGVVDHSSIFADGFSQIADGLASGVLARNGKVFFTNIPDLWLLEDEDGDGIAEKRESLHYGFGVRVGFLGHDLHGLKIGPDGKLYFSIGDRGSHVKTKDGRVVGMADTGTVFRCNLDGSDFEVFAFGLRNPQELAFDAYGNLFTGDNNSDGGDQARWVYVVEGGDSGWRIGYQFLNQPVPRGPWNAEKLWHPQWEGQAAYLVPPIANIGNGPSGLTYHPGTGFSDALKDHFFLVDFKGSPANSGIHTIKMKPNGATFEIAKLDSIIWNVLATDADFGVDGGLYLTDWVEGWAVTGKGRIYRILEDEISDADLVEQTKALMADGMGERSSRELARLLSHPDMRVRQEAQFELAERGPGSIEHFGSVLAHGDTLFAKLHAIWGLGQMMESHSKAAGPVLEALYADEDEVRGQAAKVAGNHRIESAFGRLAALCAGDSNARVRFFAAKSLGKYGKRETIAPLVAMLEANQDKDPYLRHAGVMGLAGVQDFRWLNDIVSHPSSAVRMGALLAMRRLERPEVAQFLNDPEPLLVTEAARAINDVPIESATRDLANMADSKDLSEPTWRRVVNANFRLGREEYALQLSEISVNESIEMNIRVEALQALADWGNPSGRDRITGIWSPLTGYRSIEDARRAVQTVMPQLVNHASQELTSALIDAVESVRLETASAWLLGTVRNDALSDQTRTGALAALAKLADDSLVQEAVQFALEKGSRRLQREALRWQAQSAGSLQAIKSALEGEDLKGQQVAIASLARDTSQEAMDLMGDLMSQLAEGEISDALSLDVLELVESKGAPEIQQMAVDYKTKLAEQSPFKEFAVTLNGGDVEAGRRIFLEREEVACLRCHKVEGAGGEVGPVLDGLATRQSLDYIMESMLYPNSVIAEGYESVLIETKDDNYYAGLIKEENDEKIVLNSPEDGIITIAADNVNAREKGLSGMPEGLYLMLSKREIRDLMAYLGSLK
ncbi:MAG: c-type cytochrome [Verrucomicrobia bacterium]|jgi:quinoprotein glucose dehydrogenase|nr:c-type cytochrome [Verrucomicrobiota bacterium]